MLFGKVLKTHILPFIKGGGWGSSNHVMLSMNHIVHWGINPPQKPQPLFFTKPPLNLQTVQAPSFLAIPLHQAFFQLLFYNWQTVVKTQSWIELSNSISSCAFFLFCYLKHPWKIFHSIYLLFLLFLQAHIKEGCMYLSSQSFFKTPHKALKFQQKSKKNAFSSDLQT